MSKAFDEWYEQTFGNVLGSQDEDNQQAVKKIWNGVLERAALKMEIEELDPLDGEQIADKLRRMKER
jgi:hypothetical protein